MKNRPLGSFCLVVFLFMCLLIQAGGDWFVKERSPSPLERSGIAGEKIRLTGQVYQKEQKDDCQIFYLKQVSVYDPAPSGAKPNSIFKEPKILIYDDQFTPAAIGSELLVCGKVKLYERERNPGNFNQKLYYQRQDIHGCVWASSVQILMESEGDLREWLYQFRTRWRENLLQILGERDGSVLAAMLLGEKGGMDPEVKELYQANGIGHVLAISGLHLTFIGLGIYRLMRRLCGSYPAGGAAGILFLSMYILMIGLTVSVLRALIMFLFRVGADMTGRHYDGPTALSAAAVAVLLWQPLYLYDGGFWMSFGAILAVQLILPLMQVRRKPEQDAGMAAAAKAWTAQVIAKGRDLGRSILQSLWASAGITSMLLPVLLYFFFEVPVYSVFLNLLVIPLVSVLLFLGLFGSLLCLFIYPLGVPVLQLCGVIFRLYETLCQSALRLPGARLVTGQPKFWQIFAYYVCLTLALILLWRLKKHLENTREARERALRISLGEERRRIRRKERKASCRVWTRAGLLLILGIFLLCSRFDEKDVCRITMLDVGQGDGIFIQSPAGITCFVDGGSSDVRQVGKYRIEPFLKSQGVDRLDYVFISHSDSDHVNGIQEMMERQEIGIKIGCLVLSARETWDEGLTALAERALDCGVSVAAIESGQTFFEGDLSMTCLWPEAETGGEVNELSMVLALSFGNFDMLFTGDLGQEEERPLLENLETFCPGRNFEVLKTAHHGSKNSSSVEFLEEVRPKYALISAGRNNTYGHPHTETLERLEEAGSIIYCTQETGAITITVNQKEGWYKIETYCQID